MSKLLALISPAKLLDDSTHYPELDSSQPVFIEEAVYLVKKLKKMSPSELSGLMSISRKLGEENFERYKRYETPFTHHNALQAVLMFKGDVYRGLKAEEFSKKDFAFAQDHLRILSGLYGILRPMDLVMPYRLMMGTPFSPNSKTKNLYSYWGTKIAEQLALDIDPQGVVINLASAEYFKAIDFKVLNRRVVTFEFRELKGEKYTVVMTYAKQARGMMARFLIANRIKKITDLKAFDEGGYLFNSKLSSDENWVFTRG